MNRSTAPVSRRQFAVSGIGALATLGLSGLAAAQATGNVGKSATAAEEKANVAVVSEFCAAFGQKNLDKAVALLADNCVYRPTQARPAVTGKDKIAETLKGFMGRAPEFKVLKTVALGPIVINERDDIFGASATQPARTFHVAAGVFFVENGKIAEWTDYVLQ